MAKPYQFSATLVVVTALCLLSLVEIAQSKASKAQTKGAAASPAESKSAPGPGGAEEFYVQGQVYCDTCRAQFITKASSFLQGASVRLECREREGGKMTLSVDGETDHTGTYYLPVSGDHEQEICEINLIKSPNPDCSEISKDGYSKAVARISLTSNSGLATNVRLANPIGFMMKEPLAECREILDELGVLPDQH